MTFLKDLYNRIPQSYRSFVYGAATAYATQHYGPAGGKITGKLLILLGTYLGG